MEPAQKTWLTIAIVAIIVLVGVYFISYGGVTGGVVSDTESG